MMKLRSVVLRSRVTTTSRHRMLSVHDDLVLGREGLARGSRGPNEWLGELALGNGLQGRGILDLLAVVLHGVGLGERHADEAGRRHCVVDDVLESCGGFIEDTC